MFIIVEDCIIVIKIVNWYKGKIKYKIERYFIRYY